MIKNFLYILLLFFSKLYYELLLCENVILIYFLICYIIKMAVTIIITIVIVTIMGLSGYLFYHYIFYDLICKKSVNSTLKKYNIRKTQFEIISEYYKIEGDSLSRSEIFKLEKYYRQNDPEQFLLMYDVIRDKFKNNGKKF